MIPLDLLTTLRDLGVVLTPTCAASAGALDAQAHHRSLIFGLHIDAPAGVLTPALREGLRTHKPALLALVEYWEERASIMEFDGGLLRGAAEQLAWACVQESRLTLTGNGGTNAAH